MSTYDDNPTGPGTGTSRAWTQKSSSNRRRANIRPHPIQSFIVPTAKVRDKSSRIWQRWICPLECVDQISAIAHLPALLNAPQSALWPRSGYITVALLRSRARTAVSARAHRIIAFQPRPFRDISRVLSTPFEPWGHGKRSPLRSGNGTVAPHGSILSGNIGEVVE
jgi:hypothetical protein